MTGLLKNLTDSLADAALLETGVAVDDSALTQEVVRETIEENLIEVAFAEAADYDDIHRAILRDHVSKQDIANPDECHYGDNDMCFPDAA